MALLSLIGPATKLVGKYIDNKAKKAELTCKEKLMSFHKG